MSMDQIGIPFLSVELQSKLGLMMLDAATVPDRERTEVEN